MARNEFIDKPGAVQEPRLERAGRRFGHTAGWFIGLAAIFAVPGIVLVLIGTGWSIAFGAAALLLASIPAVIGIGLLVSALVARWSARHRSFA
jgi:hypothetical protein